MDGVLASRVGPWGGREGVQADYDPARTDLNEMTGALERQSSFYTVLVSDEAERARLEPGPDGRPVEVVSGEPHLIPAKHSLRVRHPELLELDLTEAQAIALNAWSHFGGRMPDVLTAEQKHRLEAGQAP